ncbi:unnamed protein product [Microthlaspi erraticum]|uniref:Uncharacterized protein n=1 Tax=Microthlaspi erraticum TaxID=1685480 RepID=A0A6D2K0K6_9BRAS|nr:unnamed protein product [Microthlaspi erraticum]
MSHLLRGSNLKGSGDISEKIRSTLSKDGRFTKNHLAQAAASLTEKKEFLATVLINYGLHLTRVNLHNDNPPLIPRGKLIGLNDCKRMQSYRGT